MWGRIRFGGSGSRRGDRNKLRPSVESAEGRVLMTTLPKGFTQAILARNLAVPSAVAAAPDGRVFELQQNGRINIFKNGKMLPTPALTLNTPSDGELGLVGIAFDPNFAANHYLYLYYTVPGSPAHNRLSRFTMSGDVVAPGSEVPLLDLPSLGSTHHIGGSIQFGADGKIYLAVGENEVEANSQSLDTVFGKILRINPDGSIPTDNPYLDRTTGINRAIWAIGLRNPFSTAVQPKTGVYYINDVGRDAWEKIDQGAAGANYGWPVTENATGDARFKAPLYAYNHGKNDSKGAAITAGAFYNPATTSFPKGYVGKYFFGDIKSWVKVYNPATKAVTNFALGLPPALVGMTVDSSGALYLLTRGNGSNTGMLLRIKYGRQ